MGVVPNLFRILEGEATSVEQLFRFYLFAYLDSPIDWTFRESLFAYLSRCCGIRYCLVRHSARLVDTAAMGDSGHRVFSGAEVIELLSRRLPNQQEVVQHLSRLRDCTRPRATNSVGDDAREHLFVCSVAAYLKIGDSRSVHSELQGYLGELLYTRLQMLFACISMCHQIAESNGVTEVDLDVERILMSNQPLRSWLESSHSCNSVESKPTSELRAGGVSSPTSTAPHLNPEEVLSPREFAVYKHFGQGFSVRQIGEIMGLSPKTVETYQARIKVKLGMQSSREMAIHSSHWLQNRR